MSRAILTGDVNDVLKTIPEQYIDCVVTSPPYWGLRDYGTGEWRGGDAECDHIKIKQEDRPSPFDGGKISSGNIQYRQECSKCGAVRSDRQLGLEPTIEEYIDNMVKVFREVRRVLKDSGTAWVNMGDSYAGSCASGGKSEKQESNKGSWHNVEINRTPANLKPKDLIGQPWRLAFALQSDGWYLRSDIIWCLSGGTKLYVKSQKGVMPMTIKDMYRLKPETLKLWNGEKWTQIKTMIKTQRTGGETEIVLRSGERISCTPGHVWPTKNGLLKTSELQIGDVVESCRLPGDYRVDPKYLPNKIGWFIGLYIAEGSRDTGKTIQIASHTNEMERYEKLQILANDYGGTCRNHKTSENGMTICIDSKMLNAIIDIYVSGKTAKDKHLSVACWQRDNLFLNQILAGYLSGDGHWDKKNNRWRLGFTRNYNLESDLRTLCARIGAKIILKISASKIGTKEYKTLRGEIRYERSVHHNKKNRHEIVEIRKARARYYYDIEVEDDPHLFALASGVLTHNSKPNPMPESVTDRPTKSHEHVFLLSKQQRYFYDANAVREITGREASKKEWKDGDGRKMLSGNISEGVNVGFGKKKDSLTHPMGRNLRDVWTIPTQAFPEAHFATFPEKLVEPCIRAGTSEYGNCAECGKPWVRVVEKGERISRDGHHRAAKHWTDRNDENDNWQARTKSGVIAGQVIPRTTTGWKPSCTCPIAETVAPIVLDPFSGSGTVALVATKLNREFLGIELNEEYAEMSRKRLYDKMALFV